MELVSHWSAVNMALLSKQLAFLYGPSFPHTPTDNCCSSSIHPTMAKEVTAQAAYRFLHIIGNIVEISQKEIICYSPGLFKAGLKSPEVVSCLELLPDIFLKAMKVVSSLVDGYLGTDIQGSRMTFSPQRTRVNTILHMFGSWLFQAALLGTPYSGFQQTGQDNSFNDGRSEALATLCIIFNSKRHNEVIEDAYLARFFLTLHKGLESDIGVKSSSLKYVGGLMVKDLSGSNILVVNLIKALQGFAEASLTQAKIRMKVSTFRESCMEVLKTLIAVTHHFAGIAPVSFEAETKNKSLDNHQENLFTTLLQNLQSDKELVPCQSWLGLLATFLEHHIELTDDRDQVVFWTTNVLNLVCYKLISVWSSDLQTCVTACETISFIASINVNIDELVCKRVLGWICDFITLQCNKPPPSHSRDLHSSIISAFQTCQHWLLQHPFLLDDRECLTSVLEITELAISGAKSRKPVMMKEDKKLSPVSLRVSCVAEELLSSVLQKVGYHPNTSLKEKCGTRVDEEQILKMTSQSSCDPWFKPTDSFKYFFCDNNLLVAVSKVGFLTKDLESFVIMRGSSGKTVWKFIKKQKSTNPTSASIKVQRKARHPTPPDIRVTTELEIVNTLPEVQVDTECKVDREVPTLGKTNFVLTINVSSP